MVVGWIGPDYTYDDKMMRLFEEVNIDLARMVSGLDQV
jgi:hypothetical protein